MLNTIKRLFRTIGFYLSLIDDIVIDFLTDIKSLRYQLIIWAYAFNGVVLYLIYMGKADYKLAVASIGLLTLVYGMYFASKHKQAELEASQNVESGEGDPGNADRNPDNI